MTFAVCNCWLCDFSSKQETRFLAHLFDIHHLSPEQIQTSYDEHVTKEPRPLCKCGCKATLPWSGWKKGYTSLTTGSGYLRGHNARVHSNFADISVIEQMKLKRAEGLASGRTKVWNKGETKETNVSVAQAAQNISKTLHKIYSTGEVVPWQLGKTKETDVSIAAASEERLRRLSLGEISIWNKGLTKETDNRVASVSKKLSDIYTERRYHFTLSLEEVNRRINEYTKNLICLSILSDYKNKYTKLSFQCKVCQHEFQRSLMHLQNSSACPKCCPKESKGQLELFEFVKSLSADAVVSDRAVIKPKELDVWIPSKMFAIEYNGLFWHSEMCVSDSYHEKKSKLCEELGIRLLHIFEDEWQNKRPIVESVIRSRLGMSPIRLMARRCKIKEIDVRTRREFFEQNHIDGDVMASVAFGLFQNGELVSVLSLRKPNGQRYEGLFEVARFASKLNTSISGGLGRLVSVASRWAQLKNAKGLMTYVDTRFGDGHGYVQAGFLKVDMTPRRFWWVENNKIRVHRLKYKANKELGLSENEVAELNDVYRIWGCPNLVLKLMFEKPHETH